MNRKIGYSVLLAVWLALPNTAVAQWWVTKDLCNVTAPEIDPESIDATLLAQLEAGAAKIENSAGRLWRITSAAGAVSHLWGTLHSNDPIILDLPDKLRAILSQARFVALENDPVSLTRKQLDLRNQGDGFYSNVNLSNVYDSLDQRVLGWIGSRLISLGYGAESIPFLTPAAMTVLVLDDPCNDFANGVLPIQDTRIQLLGHDAGAKVLGLEDVYAVVSTLNQEDRLQTALATIEASAAFLNPELSQADRRSGFALYLQGRIGEMMAWEQQYLDEFFGPEKARRLLSLLDGYFVYERNLGFVEAAIPLLTQGGAVIAVGTFHLPGKQGLVTLFREAGFQVERVVTEGEIPVANLD